MKSRSNPGLCDAPIIFEPTFTLKGILILSDGCQASVRSGRQKSDCGYPPSIARSRKRGERRFGIIVISYYEDNFVFIVFLFNRKF